MSIACYSRAAFAAFCFTVCGFSQSALAARAVEIWHLPSARFDETSYRDASLFMFMNDGTCVSETDNGDGTKSVEINECQVTLNMVVVGNTISEHRCRPMTSSHEHRKIPLIRTPGKLVMDLNVSRPIELFPASKETIRHFKTLEVCGQGDTGLGIKF